MLLEAALVTLGLLACLLPSFKTLRTPLYSGLFCAAEKSPGAIIQYLREEKESDYEKALCLHCRLRISFFSPEGLKKNLCRQGEAAKPNLYYYCYYYCCC